MEIDRKIIDLAYERFGLNRNDKNVNVVEFDGRAYLKNAGVYDVIMVDAYRDITIPFQMSTVEFFNQVKEHLSHDGVMVVNLNMRSESEGSINEYICDTVASVFSTVLYADADGNREIFASKSENIMRVFKDDYPLVRTDLAVFMSGLEEKLTQYTPGDLILTDDKAPVELLGMKAIDEIIADELAYYKDLFKGKSVSEMIDMLG